MPRRVSHRLISDSFWGSARSSGDPESTKIAQTPAVRLRSHRSPKNGAIDDDADDDDDDDDDEEDDDDDAAADDDADDCAKRMCQRSACSLSVSDWSCSERQGALCSRQDRASCPA